MPCHQRLSDFIVQVVYRHRVINITCSNDWKKLRVYCITKRWTSPLPRIWEIPWELLDHRRLLLSWSNWSMHLSSLFSLNRVSWCLLTLQLLGNSSLICFRLKSIRQSIIFVFAVIYIVIWMACCRDSCLRQDKRKWKLSCHDRKEVMLPNMFFHWVYHAKWTHLEHSRQMINDQHTHWKGSMSFSCLFSCVLSIHASSDSSFLFVVMFMCLHGIQWCYTVVLYSCAMQWCCSVMLCSGASFPNSLCIHSSQLMLCVLPHPVCSWGSCTLVVRKLF